MEDLSRLFKEAEEEIFIMGTSILGDELVDNCDAIAQTMYSKPNLKVTILYESDDEIFRQSLAVNSKYSEDHRSFAELRETRDLLEGIKQRILSLIGKENDSQYADSITVTQVNLRLPLSVVRIDHKIWIGVITSTFGDWTSYLEIGPDHPWRDMILRYVDDYTNVEKGGAYLSSPVDELIQMYDFDTPPQPRGNFPRKAFYDTQEYQRRSIWGFVFNRKAELVLHQRSLSSADNRSMWDKSFGGHVETGEDSVVTAKRELVEEFFLSAAEHTLHIKEDVSQIIQLGDLIMPKGPSGMVFVDTLAKGYSYLPAEAWGIFVPDLGSGSNRVVLTSKRHYTYHDGHTAWRNTRFIADVYFVVAAKGFIDTQEQIERNLPHGIKGAAQAHKLITIKELMNELTIYSLNDCTYTADLYYMLENHKEPLIIFSKYVQRLFS